MKIITSLGKIELNYEKDADFPLSIDGNFLYHSDIDELYEFLKKVKENNFIDDVMKCYCLKGGKKEHSVMELKINKCSYCLSYIL